MSFDLDSFSAKDLDSLIKQANKRKSSINKRKPAAQVRSKLAAMAKAEGYTVAELFGGTAKGASGRAAKTAKATRSTGKVAPKYRNPADAKETWSGRGLPPRWMSALIKKGKKREDFLIKK